MNHLAILLAFCAFDVMRDRCFIHVNEKNVTATKIGNRMHAAYPM